MFGLDGFDDDAESGALFFEERVPAYAPLLRHIVRHLRADPEIRARLEDAWREREFHDHYDRPRLLCAALRCDALVLPYHPLADAIGAGEDASRVDGPSVLGALAAGAPVWQTLRTRYVQPNEIMRAIAWRLPAAGLPLDEPVVLADLGCSAGLTLVADRLDLNWFDDAMGTPITLTPAPPIVARVGLDRYPNDARDSAARAWLLACLWPGQPERRARLDTALLKAQAALERGEISLVAASAGQIPAHLERISREQPRARVLAYQTNLSDYLTSAERGRFEEGMRAWLRDHPAGAIWVTFERAPKGRPGPAELTVRVGEDTYVVAWGDHVPSSLHLESAELEALFVRLRGSSALME